MDKVKVSITDEPASDNEAIEYIIRRRGSQCSVDVICYGSSARATLTGDALGSVVAICAQAFTDLKSSLGFTGVSEEDYQAVVASYNEDH